MMDAIRYVIWTVRDLLAWLWEYLTLTPGKYGTLAYKLEGLLWTATGGMYSKATYSLETMQGMVEDYIQTCCDEAEAEAYDREQTGPGAEELKVLVRDTATLEELASDPEVMEKKLKARLGAALYGLALVQLCNDESALQVNGHALIVVKPAKGAGRPDHG